MTSISKSTFSFLRDLKANNNREWFNENKKRYEEAKQDFEQFVNALIGRIATFDKAISHLQAKDCVFRIYRDVRFSKDKSPYKVHMGAHITAAPKKTEIHSLAGYYVHISPGDSMLAGGAYSPESSWLKAIRQEIDYNAAEFKKILNSKSFRESFGTIEGEQLKKAPQGYSPDHPEIDLLRYKSFLASQKCPDKLVLSKDFLDHCTKTFKALYPFDQFLNRAQH